MATANKFDSTSMWSNVEYGDDDRVYSSGDSGLLFDTSRSRSINDSTYEQLRNKNKRKTTSQVKDAATTRFNGIDQLKYGIVNFGKAHLTDASADTAATAANVIEVSPKLAEVFKKHYTSVAVLDVTDDGSVIIDAEATTQQKNQAKSHLIDASYKVPASDNIAEQLRKPEVQRALKSVMNATQKLYDAMKKIAAESSSSSEKDEFMIHDASSFSGFSSLKDAAGTQAPLAGLPYAPLFSSSGTPFFPNRTIPELSAGGSSGQLPTQMLYRMLDSPDIDKALQANPQQFTQIAHQLIHQLQGANMLHADLSAQQVMSSFLVFFNNAVTVPAVNETLKWFSDAGISISVVPQLNKIQVQDTTYHPFVAGPGGEYVVGKTGTYSTKSRLFTFFSALVSQWGTVEQVNTAQGLQHAQNEGERNAAALGSNILATFFNVLLRLAREEQAILAKNQGQMNLSTYVAEVTRNDGNYCILNSVPTAFHELETDADNRFASRKLKADGRSRLLIHSSGMKGLVGSHPSNIKYTETGKVGIGMPESDESMKRQQNMQARLLEVPRIHYSPEDSYDPMQQIRVTPGFKAFNGDPEDEGATPSDPVYKGYKSSHMYPTINGWSVPFTKGVLLKNFSGLFTTPADRTEEEFTSRGKKLFMAAGNNPRVLTLMDFFNKQGKDRGKTDGDAYLRSWVYPRLVGITLELFLKKNSDHIDEAKVKELQGSNANDAHITLMKYLFQAIPVNKRGFWDFFIDYNIPLGAHVYQNVPHCADEVGSGMYLFFTDDELRLLRTPILNTRALDGAHAAWTLRSEEFFMPLNINPSNLLQYNTLAFKKHVAGDCESYDDLIANEAQWKLYKDIRKSSHKNHEAILSMNSEVQLKYCFVMVDPFGPFHRGKILPLSGFYSNLIADAPMDATPSSAPTYAEELNIKSLPLDIQRGSREEVFDQHECLEKMSIYYDAVRDRKSVSDGIRGRDKLCTDKDFKNFGNGRVYNPQAAASNISNQLDSRK